MATCELMNGTSEGPIILNQRSASLKSLLWLHPLADCLEADSVKAEKPVKADMSVTEDDSENIEWGDL